MYRPLGEGSGIRLLSLLPGDTSSPIAVELDHKTLAEAVDTYEALSYVWGDVEDTENITCDGQPFKATTNAVAFLRRIRDANSPRLLWMDAICIDQKDLKEVQSQVKIMHLIYKSAKRVIAWLGEAADESGLAMTYAASLDTKLILEQWYEERRAMMVSQYSGRPYQTRDKYWICDGMTGNDHLMNHLLTSVIKLTLRPWITRTWIQQEMAFAKEATVYCGDKTISWAQYFCLLRNLDRPADKFWPKSGAQAGADQLHPCMQSVMHIQGNRWDEIVEIVSSMKPNAQLMQLLINNWSCQSTNPRDKVYAILNLIHDQSKAIDIEPDYVKPWELLFIEISKLFYAANYGKAFQMAAPGHPNEQKAGNLPSWAIDWRYKVYGEPYDWIGQWNAGMNPESYEPPAITYSAIPEIEQRAYPRPTCLDGHGKSVPIPVEALEIETFMRDEIVYVADALVSTDTSMDSWHQVTKDFLALDASIQGYLEQNLPAKYIDEELMVDAYKRTVVADRDHNLAAASLKYCQEGHSLWREWLEGASTGQPPPTPVFLRAIGNVNYGDRHRFAVTKAGFLCLVAKSTIVGDYVAIISGCPAPMTIRSVRGSNGSATQYHMLDASCYVHGMMEGEAGKLVELMARHHGNPKAFERALNNSWDFPPSYSRILTTIGIQGLSLL